MTKLAQGFYAFKLEKSGEILQGTVGYLLQASCKRRNYKYYSLLHITIEPQKKERGSTSCSPFNNICATNCRK